MKLNITKKGSGCVTCQPFSFPLCFPFGFSRHLHYGVTSNQQLLSGIQNKISKLIGITKNE
jgi:hypothetical protein